MGTATINGELWGAKAEPWSQIQEGQVLPLYEAVFEAVGLTNGTALLDAGCGSGLALQLATKRGAVGTGLDASAALIQIARGRVPDADLRVGELEDLPYPDDSFDVATAFNSVQYAGDPGRALSEMARVVRPGGLVAVATWGQPQDCQITAVLGAVLPLMPPPPPDAPHEGPFALSEPGRLESFVSAAGLEPVITREVDCPMVYPDVETALRGQESPGVLVMAARHAGEQVLTEALRGSLGQFVQADGSVRIANTFRFIAARTAGRAMSETSMWWFLDTLVIEHELNDARDVFVFEQLLPEGASPPLHVHDGLDDSFYLLDGWIVVRRGDELFLAEPGSWVSVPRGTPHTFRVLDGSARMLLVHDDASYRDLVHDVGTPAGSPTLPEATGGPGLERLSQALVDHDSRVIGPSMSEDEARRFLLGAAVGAAR